MAATDDIIADKGLPPRGRIGVVREANRWVLNGTGEHDASTAELLSSALTGVVSIDDVDVVVDLLDVTFMDCSTVRVLVHARALLAGRNRVLTTRSTSARQQWFLGLCGLADLIGDSSDGADGHVPRTVTSLESWVDVPATTTRTVEGSTPPVQTRSVRDGSAVTCKRATVAP